MGSAVLDTAFGLAFVFLAVSLICSGIIESIANILNKRAAFLLRGLRQLLDGSRNSKLERQPIFRPTVGTGGAPPPGSGEISLPNGGLTAKLFEHPLVGGLRRPSVLRKDRAHNPSYLAASTFSQALLDLMLPEDRTDSSERLSEVVSRRLPANLPGREALLGLARDAGTDVDRFRANIEHWYDDQMGRVSGWYKRWTKKWLIVIGLALAIGANVDALAIGYSLYHDEPVRSAVAAQALSTQGCPAGTTAQSCAEDQRNVLRSLALPIGWAADNRPTDTGGWALKVLGWLLTGAAIALGSPFWFDALGKLGNWRNAGPKPAPAPNAKTG